METKEAAVIVSARSLSNFKKCGEEPGPDMVILDCLRCRTPVAVSMEGALKIRDSMRQDQTVLSGALCTPCLLVVIAIRPPDTVGKTGRNDFGGATPEEILAKLMTIAKG